MTRGAAARSRWLYLLVAAPPIVAILTVQLAPSPHGHWSEHLSAVGLKSAQLVLLIVLLTMLGWRTLSVVLAIALAVVGAGIVLQVIGDFRVADSIWRTAVNPERGPGYDEGHSMSEGGDLLVLLGGLAVAIVAGWSRRVPLKWAVGAGVLVIIPPPFLWPAMGVLVLALYALTSAPRPVTQPAPA